MIGYLIEAIRPLVLILPKMSGYIKIFKDEFGDKNNKLISLHIDDDKILKKIQRYLNYAWRRMKYWIRLFTTSWW